MLSARRRSSSICPDEAWFDIGLMQKDVSPGARGRPRGPPLPTAGVANEMLSRPRELGSSTDIAALFEVLAAQTPVSG